MRAAIASVDSRTSSSSRSVRTFKVADILDRHAACKGGCAPRGAGGKAGEKSKISHWWRKVLSSATSSGRASVAVVGHGGNRASIDVRIIDNDDSKRMRLEGYHYVGIGRNLSGLGSSPPMRSSLCASYSSYDPSKKTTLESPS